MLRRVGCLMCILAMLACSCNSDNDESAKGESSEGSMPDFPAARQSKYTGPKVQAKIKFKPGRYVMIEAADTEATQRVRAGGQSQNMDSKSTMSVTGDILINPPAPGTGERKIVYTCKHVKTTMSQGGTTQSFDSASGGQRGDLARFLRPLIGWQGVQVYSREGKFLRLEGLEHLFSQIAASAGPGGEQAMGMMKKMLEPLLREVLTKHWGKLLPEGPVAPGHTWRKKIELENFPMFGKMAFQFACRVQDIEDTPTGKVIVFDANGIVSVQDQPLNMDALPIPGKVDARAEKLRVDMRFTARFDTDIGLVTGLTGDVNVKATISIRAQGQSAMMKMDQGVKMDQSLRRVGD